MLIMNDEMSYSICIEAANLKYERKNNKQIEEEEELKGLLL